MRGAPHSGFAAAILLTSARMAASVRGRPGPGRMSSFEAGERRHLDYGYAVTSHSSQGQTADRVVVHVETDRASEKLVNQRLAYVAVSRGRYDARIYTDDKVKLACALDRYVSHRSALERTPAQSLRQSAEREISRSELVGHTMAVGRS